MHVNCVHCPTLFDFEGEITLAKVCSSKIDAKSFGNIVLMGRICFCENTKNIYSA